jgi:hypothetical protein
MVKSIKKLFICFSAKDRYNITQPVVHHLKNYGVDIWYDRYELLMGDDRINKNIKEAAHGCEYALVILSKDTINSPLAIEEIKIIEARYFNNEVVVFPVLYELKPSDIPTEFNWIRNLIFKEANRNSGTLEICNHIACKITSDFLHKCRYKNIVDAVTDKMGLLPHPVKALLEKYLNIDSANHNSRVSILYATYIIIYNFEGFNVDHLLTLPAKVFERLFSETQLNLPIDYRELWLLENAMCMLIEHYISCTEFKI